MIIRSFIDETVSAALKQVKSEMGSDAVVLKTCQVKAANGSKGYEITACLENPTASQASNSLPDQSTNEKINRPRVNFNSEQNDLYGKFGSLEAKIDKLLSLQRGETASNNELINSALDSMKKSDLPIEFISDFEIQLIEKNEELTEMKSVVDLLSIQIEDLIEPLPELKPGNRVLIMGATASGKTSLLGKLASQLVLKDKLPVKIHSLNSSKVGAIDEIESYAELLGVDVSNSSTELDLSADSDKVLLVDCGNTLTSAEPDMIKNSIEDFQATHRLAVFSCLTRKEDITRQAKQLKEFSPTHIAFTMTDLTDCWGGIIAVTSEIEVKLALMTETPSGVGHLIQPTAELISQKLLSKVESNE